MAIFLEAYFRPYLASIIEVFCDSQQLKPLNTFSEKASLFDKALNTPLKYFYVIIKTFISKERLVLMRRNFSTRTFIVQSPFISL